MAKVSRLKDYLHQQSVECRTRVYGRSLPGVLPRWVGIYYTFQAIPECRKMDRIEDGKRRPRG